MHKLILPLLIGLIYVVLSPVSALAASSTSTLIYEHWPTQNGASSTQTSLTVNTLNSFSSNSLVIFKLATSTLISSICLAVDSYNATDTNLMLGVYHLQNETHVGELIGRSDPFPFAGQYVDWYFAGEETCFTFSSAIKIDADTRYVFGVDRLVNSSNTQDILWYNKASVSDPDFYMVINVSLPGPIETYGISNHKPYIKIYGEVVPSTPDPVVIIPGILGSWEKNGQWILDPILHTYDNLVDTFLANGYVEGQTLFKFPYDWKQPNEITAFLLKDKIAEIKTICSCSKVDLVGHSMGGLVAASYIERDDYQYDVDQLFFVATPLSGAPKAYKAWEAGEMDFGKPAQNAVMQIKFRLEARKNGFENIFSYIRNRPIASIQELLPVHSDYLKIGGNSLSYPTNYPHNFFLKELAAGFSKINLRGVEFKTIAANTQDNSTIGGFTIASSTKLGLWEHGEPIATTFVAGDGTAPRTSIEQVTTIDKEFFSDHTGVASTSAPYLFKEMTGIEPEVIVGKRYNELKSFLLFHLFSPIDMQITAPDGKKLGKDFATNTEVNQIPDAFYSGFGSDNEYAVILNPLPGEYKVDTIGTGSGGAYTIAASYADQATSSTLFVVGTSTPSTVEPHTFIVSATSTTISLPPPPVATSTPITPDTCVADITAAYKAKWIGKKVVYEKLVFDCKALKGLFKTRDTIEKVPLSKRTFAQKLLLAATYAGIHLTLAEMDLLAKDKANTKDAVLLITKITTWFRNHELLQ